jgi:CubicO group peptidase (beta-lactamase class C family)
VTVPRLGRGSRIVLGTLAALVIWTVVVIGGTLEGWWRRPLAPRDDRRAFVEAATAEIDRNRPGNVAFVLLEHGAVVGEHFSSVGRPVDRDTLFQVASLSKWITAWGVMTLVEAGRIDLDAPVSVYLTRWALPPTDFDNRGVTVRRLLSHTAGLTDGLGYGGFAPGQRVQPLVASLARAEDRSPGADGAVRVGIEPGSAFEYSGGGYTLLQLIVEEVSGQSFDEYMAHAVFGPLGMTRSTYLVDDTTPNVAQFYDVDGTPAVHYRFTSLAATSLYTSAADLTRFIQAHLRGPNGEVAGRGVLEPETLELMRRPHAAQFGADIWGLGTMLYAPNAAGGFVIGHDGNNDPAINTAARVDPATGHGVVVLETGHRLLATTLAGDWVFWHTGNVDFLMVTIEARNTLAMLTGGWIAVLLAVVVFGWRATRAAATWAVAASAGPAGTASCAGRD